MENLAICLTPKQRKRWIKQTRTILVMVETGKEMKMKKEQITQKERSLKYLWTSTRRLRTAMSIPFEHQFPAQILSISNEETVHSFSVEEFVSESVKSIGIVISRKQRDLMPPLQLHLPPGARVLVKTFQKLSSSPTDALLIKWKPFPEVLISLSIMSCTSLVQQAD